MKTKFFNSTRLLKASYYNAILVIVKVISGVVTSKVVAIFLGPSGLALLGNLKSFVRTLSSFTAEGYQNGIIKYVSEHSEDQLRKNKIYATVFQLSLIFSVVIAFLLWCFSVKCSLYLFKTVEYAFVLKIVGVALPFWSFNLIIIYILNGLENYKKLVFVNAILSLGNMIVSIIFIVQYNLVGALVGMVVGPILVFGINLLVLGKERQIVLQIFKPHLFSLKVTKDMGAYFFMAMYSSAIVSITVLLIRNGAIEKLSVNEAGYWEAMTRISNFYLMFFISLTSFYLLPRLSKTDKLSEFKRELKGFYALCIPLLLIGFTIIFFLRTFILKLLLNEEFLPTSNLFFWQLVGDFISILAIALVKQFHAKKMVWAYLICNGLLNLLFYFFSMTFIDMYGVEGIVKAYALSYLIYLCLVAMFVYAYFINKEKNDVTKD